MAVENSQFGSVGGNGDALPAGNPYGFVKTVQPSADIQNIAGLQRIHGTLNIPERMFKTAVTVFVCIYIRKERMISGLYGEILRNRNGG